MQKAMVILINREIKNNVFSFLRIGWSLFFFLNWIPLPMSALCRVFFLNFVNEFFVVAILLLSLLGKGRGPSFWQIWIPFTQRCFVPSLLEIGPVVLEKKPFFKFRLCIFAISLFSLLGKNKAHHLNKNESL